MSNHEYENENASGGGGLGWFVAGLGLGALLGVLYAPKAGRETREDLMRSALEGKEYLATQSEVLRQQAAELVERGKEELDDYLERGKDYYAKSREQWNEYVERGKDTVADQVNRVSAAVDAGKEAYRDTAGSVAADKEVV
jgi:gas vesicle protein